MLHIGCHLSSVNGYEHMGQEALSIGADTFQFFTRNPRLLRNTQNLTSCHLFWRLLMSCKDMPMKL
jgi:endonuclease IV